MICCRWERYIPRFDSAIRHFVYLSDRLSQCRSLFIHTLDNKFLRKSLQDTFHLSSICRTEIISFVFELRREIVREILLLLCTYVFLWVYECSDRYCDEYLRWDVICGISYMLTRLRMWSSISVDILKILNFPTFPTFSKFCLCLLWFLMSLSDFGPTHHVLTFLFKIIIYHHYSLKKK